MIILACATERECLSALETVGFQPKNWPAPVQIGNHDMLACIVGMGPIAAALNMGNLLERYPHATGIINLGLCGSYDLEIPMANPCIADAEIFPEYGICTFQTDLTEPLSHQMLADLPLYPSNHLDLIPLLSARSMNLHLPQHWTIGRSLTVSGVTGDRDRATILSTRYNAVTENMEGFALALAARKYDIPFLEIRTVSNVVGIQDKNQWKVRHALAGLRQVLPTLTA